MLSGFTKFATRSLGTLQFGVVVTLLGSVGAAMLPQVTHAQAASRDATLAECLRYLRTQIQVYAIEHNNTYPGSGGTESSDQGSETFIRQLTGCSHANGLTADNRSEGVLGPYVCSLPTNPINGREGVWVVSSASSLMPDEAKPFGWIYNARRGEIIANSAGADSDGVAYSNY